MAVSFFDVKDAKGCQGAMANSRGLFKDVPGFNGFDLRPDVEEPAAFLLTANWDHVSWQAGHASDFLGARAPNIERPPNIERCRQLVHQSECRMSLVAQHHSGWSPGAFVHESSVARPCALVLDR